MKIGLFSDTYPPEINGVANSTYILKNELEKLGHEVYVVTTNSEGKVDTHWEEDGKVLRFKGTELKFLYGYVMTSPFHFKALHEIEKLHLDIIHDQTEFGVGIFAHICSSQLNIPLVSTYHTTYEDYTHYVNFVNSRKVDEYVKKIVAKLSRLYGNSSVRVIAPSEKTKMMLERYNIRKDINVIPTGLELEMFSPSLKNEEEVRKIREKYGFTMQDTVLISLGRLAEEKSVDIVIRAVKAAKVAGENCKLLLVGGGPDLNKLQALVKEEGLEDTVSFSGPVPKEQVPMYYRAADAFISASVTETQGMTFIEALASGLPLFARKDEVLENLIYPDETGWYYETNEEFIEQFKKFLSLSKEQRHTMSENACRTVSRYNAEEFAKQVLAVYAKALEQYHHGIVIDDIQVKDSYVQLYLLRENKDEERLQVTLDDYASLGLRNGGTITKEMVDTLREKETGVQAYQGCLRKLAAKDRTRKEMYDYLTRETTCSIETINKIIEKLESIGYIQDERYCKAAIHSLAASLQGPNRIIRSLMKKGIPVEMIEKELSEEDNDFLENAKQYAQKVLNSCKNDSAKKTKYTLQNKLVQQGYSAEDIQQVLQTMDFSDADANEIDNLKRCVYKAKQRYSKRYSGVDLRNHIFRYSLSQGYKSEDIYAVIDEMGLKKDAD